MGSSFDSVRCDDGQHPGADFDRRCVVHDDVAHTACSVSEKCFADQIPLQTGRAYVDGGAEEGKEADSPAHVDIDGYRFPRMDHSQVVASDPRLQDVETREFIARQGCGDRQ